MNNLKYKFRNITEKDYELIYQIKKEAYKKYVEMNWGSWDEDQQRELFEKFVNTYKNGTFIITYSDKDIGFYNGCTLSDDEYEIGNICIIPEYQGRGIGTAVLTDILTKNYNKQISIQYFKQNPVGRLYERLGFIRSGETEFHYQMVKHCLISNADETIK